MSSPKLLGPGQGPILHGFSFYKRQAACKAPGGHTWTAAGSFYPALTFLAACYLHRRARMRVKAHLLGVFIRLRK